MIFCNTVENYRLEKLDDFLPDFATWLKWSSKHGLVGAPEATLLQEWGDTHPEEASRALEEAKDLRVRLFRLFSARALGEPSHQSELAFLNRGMSEALGHLVLRSDESGVRMEFEDRRTPERLVWPVVYSAAALLTDPQCARLRRCGGDKCTWLFIDESRNQSRRWCDMKVCGNRAKSRAHYRKTHRATAR